MKTLAKWIANNWRPVVTEKAAQTLMRTTKVEMVWKKCKAEVESEMQVMLEEANEEPTAAAKFRLRTAAAKRVFNSMDEQQKQRIAELVQNYKNEGNSTDIRQA